ncbi:MAG TPA: hypothetical protein VFH39_02845 [Candidatus Saccharimonadales bacterium]|nr:hypothetical protein [Candidatus Saccharimonadales bacterium]
MHTIKLTTGSHSIVSAGVFLITPMKQTKVVNQPLIRKNRYLMHQLKSL